jgi:hypothetical protein
VSSTVDNTVNSTVDNAIDNATPIGELNLSVRVYNCLKRARIHTVGDLTELSDTDLTTIRNFGRACLREVKDALGRHGLTLAPCRNCGGDPQYHEQTQCRRVALDAMEARRATLRTNVVASAPKLTPELREAIALLLADDGAQ